MIAGCSLKLCVATLFSGINWHKAKEINSIKVFIRKRDENDTMDVQNIVDPIVCEIQQSEEKFNESSCLFKTLLRRHKTESSQEPFD